MEPVGWEQLTRELGVVRTPVVAWGARPALAAAARSAVSEQAAQDAEHYSSDEDSSGDEGNEAQAAAGGGSARRSPAVLWRRHAIDVRAVLGVDDLSQLEGQVVAAAERGFVAPDLVVGNITDPAHPVRAAAGPDGLVCGLFLSPSAAPYRALPRVLGVYSGAVRSRVDFDDAVAADPMHPDAQAYSFDLDFPALDCWPTHPTTLESDSVLVDARVQRNEMAFVNDARGCVTRVCSLAAGVCAEMDERDAEHISVRFVDAAVGGLPFVVVFQVAHVDPGEELLCDYGLTYWVNLRRAYSTRRAVQALLSPGSQPEPAAIEPAATLPHEVPTQEVALLPQVALPPRLAALRAVGSAGSDESGRSPRLRAGMSAAASELGQTLSNALSAGGATLDELRVKLLQLDGSMPPLERALALPFGISFDTFYERNVRQWRWRVLEAADGAKLARLAKMLADWLAPCVLQADWDAHLPQHASPEAVVAALQAGVIQASVDALWTEAEQAAASSGMALYALEENANWHDLLSTQVARTRAGTAKQRGLSVLALKNGADWRDAVLGALHLTGEGAPPPRIARLLMRAVRRHDAGGGFLNLSNGKASRDEVERILALELSVAGDAPQGESQDLRGSVPSPAAQQQPPGVKAEAPAGVEEPSPGSHKRKRDEVQEAGAADDDSEDDPPMRMPRSQHALAALAAFASDDREQDEMAPPPAPPPQQPAPAAEKSVPEVIDLTMSDGD